MRLFLLLLLPVAAFADPSRESAPPLVSSGMQLSRSSFETAVFAGGNFWSLQRHFEGLRSRGVVSTTTGYSGGTSEHPAYAQVLKGDTGHREAVQVVFDPGKISYAKLVEDFLHQTDPFNAGGQFCDTGEPFRAAIFFESDGQRKKAEAVLRKLERRLKKGAFAVSLLPARAFYPAEPRHQEFYNGQPVSYKLYVFGCGREERLAQVWGGKSAMETGHPNRAPR